MESLSSPPAIRITEPTSSPSLRSTERLALFIKVGLVAVCAFAGAWVRDTALTSSVKSQIRSGDCSRAVATADDLFYSSSRYPAFQLVAEACLSLDLAATERALDHLYGASDPFAVFQRQGYIDVA